MTSFPAWVETPPEQSDEERSTKRLQYLINEAALKTVQGGSITLFAEFVGVDRTSIHTFIASGRFSARSATKIERACGRDTIKHECLMFPLEITESAA